MVRLLLHSIADPTLSTAQSLAGSFLRYIFCVSCVVPGSSTSQYKLLLAVGWRGNERISGRFANWADKRLRGKKLKGGKWWSSLEASIISAYIFDHMLKNGSVISKNRCFDS